MEKLLPVPVLRGKCFLSIYVTKKNASQISRGIGCSTFFKKNLIKCKLTIVFIRYIHIIVFVSSDTLFITTKKNGVLNGKNI